MNIAILIMTFGGDAACLGANLEALRTLRSKGHTINILIADDAENPLHYPPQTDYVQTTFQRQGNLNGRECVAGQIKLMKGLVEEYDPDYVIKLDCDTVINSLEWIDADAAMTGWKLHANMDYCFGMCYAIHPAALDEMSEWTQDENKMTLLAHNVPEDIGTGIICRACCGIITLHQIYEAPKRACGYMYNGKPDGKGNVTELPNWAPYEGMDVVTFGNRNGIPAEVPDPRNYAGAVMRAYVNHMAAK